MSAAPTHNVERPVQEEGQPDETVAQDMNDNEGAEPSAPQLPEAPQIDLSFSLDSILSGGAKVNTSDGEKLEKLSEENSKLDRELRELQDRLAAAEQKSKELESRRQAAGAGATTRHTN